MYCSGACRYSQTGHSFHYPYQTFQKMKHSINTDKADSGQAHSDANPSFFLNRPSGPNLTDTSNNENDYREYACSHSYRQSAKCISSTNIEENRNLDLHVANLSLNDHSNATNIKIPNNANENKPVMLNMAKTWLEQNQVKENYQNMAAIENIRDETESFNPNYHDDTTPDELASYMEHYLYLPKPMSSAAEMSYS